jgi:hypothetical protein
VNTETANDNQPGKRKTIMKKLTYAGFAFLLIALSATPVMGDQCQSIKNKMDQLQIQIDKESEHLS